jgi:hypothetical protein
MITLTLTDQSSQKIMLLKLIGWSLINLIHLEKLYYLSSGVYYFDDI